MEGPGLFGTGLCSDLSKISPRSHFTREDSSLVGGTRGRKAGSTLGHKTGTHDPIGRVLSL